MGAITQSPEAKKAVLEAIAQGKSMAEINANKALPSRSSIYKWRRLDSDFDQAMEKAQRFAAHCFMHECVEMTDNLERNMRDPNFTERLKNPNAYVRAVELQVRVRENLARAWNPETYSEKRTVKHHGAVTMEHVLKDIEREDNDCGIGPARSRKAIIEGQVVETE